MQNRYKWNIFSCIATVLFILAVIGLIVIAPQIKGVLYVALYILMGVVVIGALVALVRNIKNRNNNQ